MIAGSSKLERGQVYLVLKADGTVTMGLRGRVPVNDLPWLAEAAGDLAAWFEWKGQRRKVAQAASGPAKG